MLPMCEMISDREHLGKLVSMLNNRHVTHRRLLFALAFALVFGIVDVLAQAVSGERASLRHVSLWRAVLSPLLAFGASWLLFAWLDSIAVRRGSMRHPAMRREPSARASRVQMVLAFVLPLATWVTQYLAFWPMVSMNDTHFILMDPLAAAAHGHPLMYNLYLTAVAHVGEWLFGSFLGGVVLASLVQIALWVLVAGGTAVYLLRVGVHSLAVWALTLYLALMPIVGNYSFALVKDAMFSLFVVAAVPLLLQIYRTRGEALKKPWFFVAGVLVLFGFATMRNNGLAVLAVVLLLVLFYAGNARRLATVFVAVSMLVSAAPSLLNSSFLTSSTAAVPLVAPLQSLGYAYVAAPECVSTDNQLVFDEVLPRQIWAEQWTAGSIDPVWYSPEFNMEFFQSGSKAFVGEWLQVAARCPGIIAAGYLMHTGQLWRVDALPAGRTGGQSMFTSVVSNQPGALQELLASYASLGVTDSPVLPQAAHLLFVEALKQTPGHGTWMWVVALTLVGFVYRRRGEWVPILAPSLLIWLSLMAFAPDVNVFRYIQFISVVAPIAVAVLLGSSGLRRVPAISRKRRSDA